MEAHTTDDTIQPGGEEEDRIETQSVSHGKNWLKPRTPNTYWII